MLIRAATQADLDTVLALQHAWETSWFGAPELAADELWESLARAQPIGDRTRLVFFGATLVGAAWHHGGEATLLLSPESVARPAVRDTLLAWLETQPQLEIDVLSGDADLLDALHRRGWTQHVSAFELLRTVAADWVLPEPDWPADITVTDLTRADTRAVYDLIYHDAGWGEVPGHHDRGYDDWRAIFIAPDTAPALQVLAWHGDRLVGAAIGRTWADGTGYIGQLAVAREQRRRGLGRALLLEGLRCRMHAGASSLGLQVMAPNVGALSLYLDVGLRIEREWRSFRWNRDDPDISD